MSSKKAKKLLCGEQPPLDGLQCFACCPTENRPCSPPSPWCTVWTVPLAILPQISRRFRVEQPHKRKCLAPPVQPKQHGPPRDGVIRAYAINGCDCGFLVKLFHGLKGIGTGLWWPSPLDQLLHNGLGCDSLDHLSGNCASHSSVFFPQCCHASQLDPASLDLTHCRKQMQILGRFQQRAEVVMCHSRRTSRNTFPSYPHILECSEGPWEALECHLALLQGGCGTPSMSLQYLGPPLPADNSPNCTNFNARVALWSSSTWSLRLCRLDNLPASSAHLALALNKSCHCPAANLSNRAINLSLLICPLGGVGATASLGATTRASNSRHSKQNFFERHFQNYSERTPQETWH